MRDKSTRIKYKLTNDRYESTRMFLGNEGTLLHSFIDPKTGLVGVADSNGITVEETSYEAFSKAKTVAKDLLKKYGVTFLDEVRKKKEVASEVQ